MEQARIFVLSLVIMPMWPGTECATFICKRRNIRRKVSRRLDLKMRNDYAYPLAEELNKTICKNKSTL